MKAKQYRSKIAESVHQAMADLHQIGLIDRKTMRTFDEDCLTEIQPMTPADIAALREREEVSQAVLARYLNVAPKLVGEWERGDKRPSGPSLKLLSLIAAKGLEAIA